MAIDPVCGMTVDEKSAVDAASYGGEAYHFCSARCLNQFQADPAKFVGRTYVHAHAHSHTMVTPIQPEKVGLPEKSGKEMVKDPICGMVVDKATALKAERAGRSYYFCSIGCQRTLESPEHELKSMKTRVMIALGGVLLLFAAASTGAIAAPDAPLQELIAEAARNNPEIRAASNERLAARHRVSPAGALDDPMLEAGVINAPSPDLRLNREEMTMKMLGLSQKFPFPGKRDLRQAVAAKDAESTGYAYQETVNRVVRDVRVAYFELAFVVESARLVDRSTRAMTLNGICRHSQNLRSSSTSASLGEELIFARLG